MLELEELKLIVVNAQHIKAVQGSYIPKRELRELREIIRYRRSIIEERSRGVNRCVEGLEGGNIILSW